MDDAAMMDKVALEMVRRSANQTLVLSHWLLNRTLQRHPELTNSDETQDLRRAMRELTEKIKELDND